jgi:hypothetical protein
MWRTIDGFSNYEVSINGEIRNRTTLKVLKIRKSKGGNDMCLLVNNNKYREWVYIQNRMDAVFTMDEIINN